MEIKEKAVGIAEIIWHDRYFKKCVNKDFFKLFYRSLSTALCICSQEYSSSQLDSFKILIPKWRVKQEFEITQAHIFKPLDKNDLPKMRDYAFTRYFWFMDGISKKRTELDCWDTVRVFDGQILPCGCTTGNIPRFLYLKAQKANTLTHMIVHEIIDAIESKECEELINKTQIKNACAKGYRTHEEHHDQIILKDRMLYNRFYKLNPKSYTPYENEVLKILYPKASRETIEKELKFRSWRSIRTRAYDLGIKRGG